MAELNEQSAKKAIEYVVTILRLIERQTENITETMISASALLRAVAEKFPDVAEKYGRYHEEAGKDSPLVASSRGIIDQVEVLVRELQKTLKI